MGENQTRAATPEYRDNWDRMFAKKDDPSVVTEAKPVAQQNLNTKLEITLLPNGFYKWIVATYFVTVAEGTEAKLLDAAKMGAAAMVRACL